MQNETTRISIFTFVDKYGVEVQVKRTEDPCPECDELLYYCIDSEKLFCNELGCEYLAYPEEYKEQFKEQMLEEKQHKLDMFRFNELFFSPIQWEEVLPFWMIPTRTLGIGFTCDLWMFLERESSIKTTIDFKRHDSIIYLPSLMVEALGIISQVETYVSVERGLGGVMFLVGTNFYIAIAPRLYD